MTNYILCYALLVVLHLSLGFSGSIHSPGDIEHPNGNNGTEVFINRTVKYLVQSPGYINLTSEFIVNPDVSSFDDYHEQVLPVFDERNATKIRIGIIFGSIVIFLFVLGCVLCCCRRRRRQRLGVVLNTNRVERAIGAQPSQPVVMEHYPPTQGNVQQFPPQYQPPVLLQSQYPTAHLGFQYSPAQQQFQQQSPNAVQSNYSLQFQNEVTSPYGPPPVVRY